MRLEVTLRKRLPGFALDVAWTAGDEVAVLFGPSGVGKTLTLQCLAGLIRPDAGRITVDGRAFFDAAAGIEVPPQRRRIGYVFQGYALFPHLTVEENVAFGLRDRPRRERTERTGAVLDRLGLRCLAGRRPPELSGGERQRVALGRALLASPRLLLMDEPLSSLDQGLKSRIIPYLRHIRSELGIPILYVSHSVAEILELTGQVIFLDRGEVVAQGDFFHLAHHPRVLPLVEEHGFENVLPVEVLGTEVQRGFTLVRHGAHQFKIPLCEQPAGSRIFIGIRADDIILCRARPEGLSVRNFVEGQVVEISKVDGKGLVYVEVGKRLAVKVTAEAIAELGLEVGQTITCLIKTHSIRIGPEVE